MPDLMSPDISPGHGMMVRGKGKQFPYPTTIGAKWGRKDAVNVLLIEIFWKNRREPMPCLVSH